MKELHFPLEKVLELIDASEEGLDPQPVRDKVMDVLLECCGAEGAVMFLPDGRDGFRKSVRRNFSEKSEREFQEYFYRFDPLRLFLDEPSLTRAQSTVMDYSGYEDGEYYCDFLRPNGIRCKLLVYLLAEEGLQGKVILTRPEGEPVFSGRDAMVADELSPYLAYAMTHNALRNRAFGDAPEALDEDKLSSDYKLSPREIEVARLIFDGMHNAEIAERLFVSEITVKKHLQNMYAKLGVNTRTALINRVLTARRG